MNGVMMASVSPGSSHFGASVTWTAHVIWPSGAAAAGVVTTAGVSAVSDNTTRPSDRARDVMTEAYHVALDHPLSGLYAHPHLETNHSPGVKRCVSSHNRFA